MRVSRVNILAKLQLYFDWWLDGLKLLCPAFVRSLLLLDKNALTIELSDNKLTLKHYLFSANMPVDEAEFELNNSLQEESALNWINSKNNKPLTVVVLIPRQLVLTKTFNFPAAANNNLKEALGFEISRRTPFSPEQVYFDYSVLEHNKKNNKLKVILAIAPRDEVDSILSKIEQCGIDIDGLSSTDLFPEHTNISLMPEKGDVKKTNNKSVFYYAGVTILLFVASLYVPLNKQNQAIEELEMNLNSAKSLAIKLNKLSDEKKLLSERVSFLADKQNELESNLRVLNEVTRIFPDNTWSTRFSIKNEKLEIQGESAYVSGLIQNLESSKYFENVQFISPTIKNNRTQKEKFHLSAELVNEQ